MKTELANTLTIRSSEGVSFAIPLAGPMSRFLAWAIDVGVIATVLMVCSIFLAILGTLSADAARGFYIALAFFTTLGYGIALEWLWRGQTIGKRMMGLRVIDERGLKLRFEQVVLRNLLRIVDRLPLFYMVGGLTCLVSSRNQRLGDIAAGTIVTFTPKAALPDIQNVLGDKFNSFRNHPHLEARLRQTTPPLATALALDAISRRDDIDPDERVSLFRQFADYFRALVAFPEEDTIGITDEQYVRNVIDTIYNTSKRKRQSVTTGPSL